MKTERKDITEINSTNLIDKGNYLIEQGWTQKNQMIYIKKGIEIFFDNSNSIEIYRSDNNRLRLDDFRAQSIKDLMILLSTIEDGKYD